MFLQVYYDYFLKMTRTDIEYDDKSVVRKANKYYVIHDFKQSKFKCYKKTTAVNRYACEYISNYCVTKLWQILLQRFTSPILIINCRPMMCMLTPFPIENLGSWQNRIWIKVSRWDKLTYIITLSWSKSCPLNSQQQTTEFSIIFFIVINNFVL